MIQKKPPKVIDPDPEGKILIQLEDKLGASSKIIKVLEKEAFSNINVHLLAFEVYIRKKKYLLALKSLKKAHSIDSNYPELHKKKIQFFLEVSKIMNTLSEPVKSVIESEKLNLVGSSSLIDFNNSFLDIHKLSSPHRSAAAQIMFELEPNRKSEAIELVKHNDYAKGRIALKNKIHNYQLLKDLFGDLQAAESYRLNARKQFPYAISFMNETEKKSTS